MSKTFLTIIIFLMIFILHLQGRFVISQSGQLHLWISDAWGSETSQQLFDPYSFSHFIHGICFFGLLYLFRNKFSLENRFVLSVLIEAAWEILENSPLIINRYREATAALGYSGDTVLNSLGDLISCSFGFFAANYLGLKKSVVLIFVIEILLLFWIKDCLFLNIIMLIYPIESIRLWQINGQ